VKYGVAIAIYALDAFVLNQGALAVLAALWTLLMLLPALFNRFRRRHAALRFFLFTAVACLTLATNSANNKLARARAETLIAKCNEFHQRNGRYPWTLDEVAEVPLAKLTLFANRFEYGDVDGVHTLQYVALPPFGRAFYRFEDQNWDYLD
jgi:hypothetical protein